VREDPSNSADQYAVVYSHNHYYPPDIGEDGLLEQAICIRHTDAEPPLERSARVCFGIRHHIQYHIPVRDIGFVHPDWLLTFMSYWKMVQAKGNETDHDIAAEIADINDCQDEPTEIKCSEHDSYRAPDHFERGQLDSLNISNGQTHGYTTEQTCTKSLATGPATRIGDVATPVHKGTLTYSLTPGEMFSILDETVDSSDDFDWSLD
jgi:hypothetical protein